MKPRTHRVSVAGTPACLKVTVDGHPLRTATRVLLDLAAGELPRVHISLAAVRGADGEVDAEVTLGPGTQDLLRQLGWIPASEAAAHGV